MKNLHLTICAWLLIFAFGFAAHAQTKRLKTSAPKTVADFYMKIPDKYLSVTKSHPNRRALIKTVDAANGYIKLGADDWNGWGEIALFKRANGGSIVAVTDYDCAAICDGSFYFLEYKNGKWTELDLLPRYSVGDLRTAFHGVKNRQPTEDELNNQVFELPRAGKEITLKIGGVAALGFLWEADEFVSGMIYLAR